MDLTGFGVLLIGISFLLLAIYLSRVLNSFSNVMTGVEKTMDQLPSQLDDILNETGNLIHHSNDTLADVNEKLETLTPLFQIVGDVGESTRTLSSSLVDVTKAIKKKKGNSVADELTENKRLGGLYGTTALGYYLLLKRKELSKGKNRSNLYEAGKQRSTEIKEIKTEAMIQAK